MNDIVTPIQRAAMNVNIIHQLLKDEEMTMFLSTMAMVMEEKCKDMGVDMVETCENLLEAARSVNAELGKWGD